MAGKPPVGREDDLPNYPIGSVDNALRLLLMFSQRRSVRVADASRELGVARSTAHRLMRMLQYHGFIEQDSASQAYRAGPALVRMGVSVVRQLDVRTVSRASLSEVVAELGETVHLVELHGTEAVFLDSVESPRVVRVSSRVGQSLPAHCTSTGKVLLAELAPEEFQRRFRGVSLSGMTDRTITDMNKLEEELARIRRQGYATNFGESEGEVYAVAVPLRDVRGVARASISVAAPPSRMEEDAMPKMAQVLMRAADEIRPLLPV